MNTEKLNKYIKMVIALFGIIRSFGYSYAHCPLCATWAWIAGGIAVWLWVSPAVVALFIGAFAMTIWLWMANILKTKYFGYQDLVVVVFFYIITVVSTIPFVGDHIYPLYISMAGDYGSLLNNTYALNLSWIAAVVWGIIVLASSRINKKLKKLTNWRFIPFQRIIITMSLLILVGIGIQFVQI